MEDLRGKLRHRAENKADSICYTYKQHFAAANFYRTLSRVLDGVMFAAAALILANSFWEVMPNQYIAFPALLIAAVTGYRRGTHLEDRAEEFRRSARRYHSLFDEYRDFLMITVTSSELSDEEVKAEFSRLSDDRRELNQTTPDASEIWYQYIKWKGEERIQEEITTTPATRDALSGRQE
ncbi:SLATT domain-containing protein [Halogeometricum sp. S1BR25-6]|uniref:SLATT domain-containing protein n=1 Tax=Halogeometricum salsisoli TaxID=2950536 RepID=A0ABU2GBN4_9EURY|nr:SLATT domain-containing protein [Halogeometricum sp. S1BR25-6]MDS0297533.1 SLATT domain-containing protein [Halogeometricum sp. S1BR25-6]